MNATSTPEKESGVAVITVSSVSMYGSFLPADREDAIAMIDFAG